MWKPRHIEAFLGLIKDIKIDASNPKRFTVYVDQTFRSEYSSGIYVYPEHAYDSTGLMRKFTITELTDPKQKERLEKDPDIIAFAKKIQSIWNTGHACSILWCLSSCRMGNGTTCCIGKKRKLVGRNLS